MSDKVWAIVIILSSIVAVWIVAYVYGYQVAVAKYPAYARIQEKQLKLKELGCLE